MDAHSTAFDAGSGRPAPNRGARSYGDRLVRIHLPPGYDPARREKYPLLLLHDGQNVFSPAAADAGAGETENGGESASIDAGRPPHRWRVDETIDRLVLERRIPAVVTAAIDHAGERRIAEFTPTQGGKPEAGRARDYSRLVFNEILPGLAQDFHVKTDAPGMAMGGSSMGGLITLWLAAMQPGRFGRLIVMSPSVWWDDRVILRTLKTRPLEPPPRVWLDCGKREGPIVLKDTRALRDVLRSNPHLHLKYVEDEHGDHSEVAWGGRLSDALTWIYGAELPLSARLRPRTDPPPQLERRSTPRLGRR